MLKTIIIISIVILVNSQNSKQADCSKIDQIIKDVDVGLKLSKIKAELQSLTQFQQELESATLGFRAVVGFIKKLKDTYEHKVLLQTSQVSAGGPSKSQPSGIQGPNSPQRTYNQLASALSEIRAVSKILPELQKAELIFESMRDDIIQFKQLAKDLNIDQKQIDTYLQAQKVVQQCKGSQYVLEPNIYESSTSDEEETHHHDEAKKAVQQSPQHAKQAPAKDQPSKVAPAKDSPAKVAPLAKKQSINSKPLGKAKSHLKHNAIHKKSKQIIVKKRL